MKFIQKFNCLLIGALLVNIVLAVFSQGRFWQASFSFLALLNIALLAISSREIHFQPRSELFRWCLFWAGLIIAGVSWLLFLGAIMIFIFESNSPLADLLAKNFWLFLATSLILVITTIYYGVFIASPDFD